MVEHFKDKKTEQMTIPPFNPLVHPLIGATAAHTFENLYCMLSLLTRIFDDRAKQEKSHHMQKTCSSTLQTEPFTAEEERGLSLMCGLLQHAISAAASHCEMNTIKVRQ